LLACQISDIACSGHSRGHGARYRFAIELNFGVCLPFFAFGDGCRFSASQAERSREIVESINPASVIPVASLGVVDLKKTARRMEIRVSAAAPLRPGLAAALAQKGPPFDAEKVAMLKAAISSGTYQVDPSSTAICMIRFGGQSCD
jgi:flagellar biosynthesis anti-sigma factor FlgM